MEEKPPPLPVPGPGLTSPYRKPAGGMKMEKIEMPSGFIRTWKATLFCGLIAGLLGGAAYTYGHSSARVEVRVDRVEVPYPDQCVDTMTQVHSDDKDIKCPHPEHHGEFKTLFFTGWQGDHHYLVCQCPHAQLTLPEASAK
jgi:hypothetical protein